MRARVFSRAEMCSPFGVRSERCGTGIFHAVVRGRVYLRADGDEQTYCLSRGDVALLPRGSGHILSDAPTTVARPISELIAEGPSGRPDLLEIPGAGPKSSILCGLFSFEERQAHAMVPALPIAVVANVCDAGPGHSLMSIFDMISDEINSARQGSEVILSSLAEVLMVNTLRIHIESSQNGPGWLCALRDPKLGEAIGLIHKDPARNLSAADLARAIGLSRSELFARFSQLVGEPPARYITRVRMNLASQALIRETLSLAEVAQRIGYSSEASFSKAFKRFSGDSPGVFRSKNHAGAS